MQLGLTSSSNKTFKTELDILFLLFNTSRQTEAIERLLSFFFEVGKLDMLESCGK